MGKVEIGIYFCVTADILTKVHFSPFITLLVITRFWLEHGSLITRSSSMDPKHCVIKGLPCITEMFLE